MLTPPNTQAAFSGTYLPYVRTLSNTCAASSRVGVRMSARTGWRAGETLVLAWGLRRCNSGRVNAAVFPVPVWAAGLNVLPGEDRGNRLFLDGGGLGVALLLDCPEQLGREAEIRELHACGYSRCSARPRRGHRSHPKP